MQGGECREKSQYEGDCKSTGYNPGYNQQPMHQRQEGDRPSNATIPVTQQSTQEEEEQNRHHGMDESTKKKLEVIPE